MKDNLSISKVESIEKPDSNYSAFNSTNNNATGGDSCAVKAYNATGGDRCAVRGDDDATCGEKSIAYGKKVKIGKNSVGVVIDDDYNIIKILVNSDKDIPVEKYAEEEPVTIKISKQSLQALKDSGIEVVG